MSCLKRCCRSNYMATQTKKPLGLKATKHVTGFIFNSIYPHWGEEIDSYQLSFTVTFCNISIMPSLILEKTCKQQAYRKAYWPSPSVYFPVRVYSSTLSGTHCCPPRMTSRDADIVSVPERLSIYSFYFQIYSFVVCRIGLYMFRFHTW